MCPAVQRNNYTYIILVSSGCTEKAICCCRFLARYPEYPEPFDNLEICLDEVAKDLSECIIHVKYMSCIVTYIPCPLAQ